MARRIALSEEDAAALAEAMRGARRLGGPERVASVPSNDDAALPRPRSRRIAPGGGPGALARPRLSLPNAEPADGAHVVGDANQENWALRRDGADSRLMKRLRGGQLPMDARLDLHGLTRTRAAQAVDRFLTAARESRRRGLLIIHGRGLHSGPGGPTLREVVRAALAQGTHATGVLAATSAPPAMGGPGATVVWLRRA